MRPTSGKIITEEIAPFHQIIVDVVVAVVVVVVVVDVVVVVVDVVFDVVVVDFRLLQVRNDAEKRAQKCQK